MQDMWQRNQKHLVFKKQLQQEEKEKKSFKCSHCAKICERNSFYLAHMPSCKKNN